MVQVRPNVAALVRRIPKHPSNPLSLWERAGVRVPWISLSKINQL
jgi:hypothetical protein